jgi:hypothetical protein
VYKSEIITRAYNNRVGHILNKHSGSVKTLNLEFYGPYNADTSHCLDSWLRTAVKPGIEELTLKLHSKREQSLDKANYNFPCSLLSNGSGNSIRALDFVRCAIRPTEGLGCMRNCLFVVCILRVMSWGSYFPVLLLWRYWKSAGAVR